MDNQVNHIDGSARYEMTIWKSYDSNQTNRITFALIIKKWYTIKLQLFNTDLASIATLHGFRFICKMKISINI